MVFIGNVRGHEIGPLYTLLQHTRRHRHLVSHRITLDQGGFTTGYMHCKFIEIRGAISTGDTLTSRFTRGGYSTGDIHCTIPVLYHLSYICTNKHRRNYRMFHFAGIFPCRWKQYTAHVHTVHHQKFCSKCAMQLDGMTNTR